MKATLMAVAAESQGLSKTDTDPANSVVDDDNFYEDDTGSNALQGL